MDLQFVCEASLRLYTLISWKSVFFSVFPFFFYDPHRFRSRFVVAPNSAPFLRVLYCLLFYYFFFPSLVAMIQCSCLRVFVWHCCNRNSTVGAENVGKCLFDAFPSPCLQFLRKLMQKCSLMIFDDSRKWNVFKTRGIFLIRNFERILLHKKLNNEGNPSDEVFENLHT